MAVCPCGFVRATISSPSREDLRSAHARSAQLPINSGSKFHAHFFRAKRVKISRVTKFKPEISRVTSKFAKNISPRRAISENFLRCGATALGENMVNIYEIREYISYLLLAAPATMGKIYTYVSRQFPNRTAPQLPCSSASHGMLTIGMHDARCE